MEQSAHMSPGQALMSEGMGARDRLVEEIVLVALFLVSTAANSLALLVFCRRPGLRTISNRFVINLLATNLLTTSLLAPALFGEHSAIEDTWLWMEAGDVIASACSLVALLAVMLIALDQHHAVTDPLRCHTRLLQRRPATLCAGTWFAALFAAAVRAALAIVRYFYPSATTLQGLQIAYYAVYLSLGVIMPIAVVCIMYARIYRAARSSGLRARAHGASALQLYEPQPNLPDLAEEGEGLTLKIDGTENSGENDRKFGPFLLPPERPMRCPSVASLRNSRKEGKSSEDLRKGLPSVSSAPALAAPLLSAQQRNIQPQQNGSRITSIRCRISNASLFRYREESRAARVGLLTGALAMLHVPHALTAVISTAIPELAEYTRSPSLALILLASAASPFLFALRSRRVQREARRIFLPEKSAWERASSGAATAAAADGQRARAALDLLRTLSPGSGNGETAPSGNGADASTCRGSFSSGGSTQLSSASDE